MVGQDIEFAWHYWQVWTEVFEVRYAIPKVGDVGSTTYITEVKYKFPPEFFGTIRWNQQLFTAVPNGTAGPVPWGREIWQIDVVPGYWFTAHTQLKLQYSLEHEHGADRDFDHIFAAQFTVRF